MEIIKLNLIPNGVNPTCHCSQYDEGRVIRIELFDGLTPYTLQSGDTVTLNVRKPDNTIVTASVTATQGNNYVDIVTTEQICACVGYNLCDLTITNGETEIGTLNFIMTVERDVLADGIASQSVIEDLDALVQEAVGDNYYTKSEVDNIAIGKVDKNGIGQVNENNTTFFTEIPSENILALEDEVVTESPLTLTVSNEHIVTTISEPLEARAQPIFAEMLLTAGTYTLGVFADEDYSAFGGSAFIGLYTGVDKNVLFEYAYVGHRSGRYKTFTVTENTTVYLRFRTQDLTPCNTIYSQLGSLGCKVSICKTSELLPWISSKPTYKLKWSAEDTPDCANISMFEKIGVIGDSYASGQIYLSGSPVNYYNLSWGQVLARRIGSTCINFSRGGLTTKTWLSDNNGLPLLQSSDAQGLYIVALGINDYTEINAERYSLGTSSDFDLSDYENTPDTFYGNICKIIGYIQAKSPNAKIILSTMAKNDNTLSQNINTAIETCAALANIVSIRQYEESYFQSSYYINGMINGHPTAPVYSGMAKAIERLINKSMSDNYNYFYTYIWNN